MYQLAIGNKNYSSWSMRPWVLMTHFGLSFREINIALRTEQTAQQIQAVSPSGRVPVLVDGDLHVWDSLAIAEYLAEQHPEHALWPRDKTLRALARAASAEMHSGFSGLRNECSMNIKGRFLPVPSPQLSADALADIARIKSLWQNLLARSGGPFLCGDFSIVDAFFAPVVTRFRTYRISLPDALEVYAQAIEANPAVKAWIDAGMAETVAIPFYDALLGMAE